MHFCNKLIWIHSCEYHSLETWSDINHFNWHTTHSYTPKDTKIQLRSIFSIAFEAQNIVGNL